MGVVGGRRSTRGRECVEFCNRKKYRFVASAPPPILSFSEITSRYSFFTGMIG